MARAPRVLFACSDCGGATPRWVGRCPSCGSWNSLVEQAATPPPRSTSGGLLAAVAITDVAPQAGAHRSTGVEELDRVLGGGLVPGSVVLLAGEPGIGKSTLLLQVLARLARAGRRVLYVCGEESREQVRLRAERLDALAGDLLLAAETDLGRICDLIEAVSPSILVVDSIQTVADPEAPGGAGGVGQVRECAAAIVRIAKERGMATFLVGQVTKDGAVAGPKTLEHVVDVVVNFEGDAHHALRLVRCTKNRFGPAHEVGCFEMTESGLVGLADPSRLFLSARDAGVSGVACTVSLEGRRPLATEIQALVVPTAVPMPRRTAQGLDPGRLAILVAVLERRARVPLAGQDVFAATAGGVRVTEPAADLAVCLALASAVADSVLPPDLVAFGEVGLGGEVRPVPQLARRLAEAARLGFHTALVPRDRERPSPPGGLALVEVATVSDAVRGMPGSGGPAQRPERASAVGVAR